MSKKAIKVKDIANIQSGYAFKSKMFNDSKGLPIIRIRNITSQSIDTFYDGDYSNEYIVDNGDLLVSMDGEFKIIKWKKGKGLLNQRVCRIHIRNEEAILKDYLLYFLPRKLKDIEDRTPFVTVKHLSVKDINNIDLHLPSIETQKKIVEVLDKAQVLIDARKEQIKLLDDLIQSTFYDMFGDPVTNPKGWEKEPLGKLCDIYRGGSPRPIKDYLGGTIPWIKIGDATKGDNIYLSKTDECIREEGVKKSRLVKKGNLIFANCGVSLGFARIIKFDGCIHDGWLSLENIDKKVDKIFLLKLLNCFTEYFRNTAPDGTQPNLNTGIMKAFEIILPPVEMQINYRTKLETIIEQKQLMEKSLKEMENNYHSLMQRAFKGELFS